MSIPVDISKVEVTSYPHCMVIALSSDAFYCLREVSHIFVISLVWFVEGPTYEVGLVFQLDSDKYQFTWITTYSSGNISLLLI